MPKQHNAITNNLIFDCDLAGLGMNLLLKYNKLIIKSIKTQFACKYALKCQKYALYMHLYDYT